MKASTSTPFKSMSADEILRLVRAEMELVEEEFRKNAASPILTVSEISRYLQKAGGKRIRPVLVLLSSKMVGFNGEAAVRLASVVEMIHTATLVHDDIIDDAKTRRGQSSVNSRWGNQVTVLFGDWLYMTSFHVALAERNFKILDALIDVTRKMVEGELLQLNVNGKSEIDEGQQLEISSRKTAVLFSVCTRLGAILARASESQEARLARYGLNAGMAFQLIDDILDFTSSQEELGKPVLSDLKEGKVTLPLIYLLRLGDPEHRRIVEAVLSDRDFHSVAPEQVIRLVRDHGTLEMTRRLAQRYAEEAKESLAGFEPSIYRDALLSIPEFIIARKN